jgi:hypothetical protein
MVAQQHMLSTRTPLLCNIFGGSRKAPPKPLVQAAQQISTATAVIQLGVPFRVPSTFAQLQPNLESVGNDTLFSQPIRRHQAGADRARTNTPPTRSPLIPCLHNTPNHLV